MVRVFFFIAGLNSEKRVPPECIYEVWYRYWSRLSSYPHVALRYDLSEKKAFFVAAILLQHEASTLNVH